MPTLSDNPNVVAVWITLEATPHALESVVVVETNLHLDDAHPEYDADKVDELVADIRDYIQANRTIDRVRVTPIRS